MTTRKLLEGIRRQLLSEKAVIILKDKEMKEIQKVVSRAIGKKADMRMGDSDYHTGAIDFGGQGAYDLFVGSKNEDGELPYNVSVEDIIDGDHIESATANDYKSMLKLVTKLAKKHKKGMTQE
tara:strand:+ start:487 stop:855 length:369 start_codon:yes stop_codon:yes gene_type:complete